MSILTGMRVVESSAFVAVPLAGMTLAQMGADHYENSVVLGDHAYTVKPGFVALPIGQDGSEMNLDGSQWGTLLYAFESLGAA